MTLATVAVAVGLRAVLGAFVGVEYAVLANAVTSFPWLMEGAFVGYASGVFHQSPLLLPLAAFIHSLPHPALVQAMYIAMDLAVGWAVYHLAKHYAESTGRNDAEDIAQTCLRWFLLNPWTMAACAVKSSTVFTQIALALTLLAAVKGGSGVFIVC